MRIDDGTLHTLVEHAHEARKNAYAPYSGFKVGAAVLCEDGKIFVGANVENSSFGLTMCAERVAIHNAISSGEKKIEALAIVAEKIAYPCGACLQVIAEFAEDDLPIIIADEKGEKVAKTKLFELLPKPFRLGGK
ncbi:MAG TPA: cytidine deaminase [candidate division Zixibacteria bacterium]|nr:cytidine deaminase [candidate division Zixibacteria bacterium]